MTEPGVWSRDGAEWRMVDHNGYEWVVSWWAISWNGRSSYVVTRVSRDAMGGIISRHPLCGKEPRRVRRRWRTSLAARRAVDALPEVVSAREHAEQGKLAKDVYDLRRHG